MTKSTSDPLIRVERGRATEEELAAVTAVLLRVRTAARTVRTEPAGRASRLPAAAWCLFDRPAFRAAHSWLSPHRGESE
ncbi:acyl-CoA carboxylase subunit epsilon [Streptomyces sp. NPDC101151]|uniref:acyl-CoA carboxylase subunit epsilon n=1 Tax=Streptomyces sp. NPDC101151 TaxID=3366115 RepID=UPI00381BC56A